MRKLICIVAILLMATAAQAATVTLTFEWDANQEPDLAGYRLYMADASGSYTKGQYIQSTAVVTTTTETIDIEPGEIVYFALTAFDLEGMESGFSNEVSFFLPQDGTGVAPAAPTFRLRSWADASLK